MRHEHPLHLDELGLCQVEGALAFDLPCPQPCAHCNTVAVEVTRKSDGAAMNFHACTPASTPYFPFAPGAIERHRRPRRRRTARVLVVVVLLAAASAAVGLMAGYFHARGWL